MLPTIYFLVIVTILGLGSCTRITLHENMNKQGKNEACFLRHFETIWQDKFYKFLISGEELKLKEISNCTTLPQEWQDRTSSLNIHKSVCVKVFEHADCKGRYVTLRASLHSDSEYLDNLRELGFNDVISSVSPCALQGELRIIVIIWICDSVYESLSNVLVEPGQYVIQNLGDNKVRESATRYTSSQGNVLNLCF